MEELKDSSVRNFLLPTERSCELLTFVSLGISAQAEEELFTSSLARFDDGRDFYDSLFRKVIVEDIVHERKIRGTDEGSYSERGHYSRLIF